MLTGTIYVTVARNGVQSDIIAAAKRWAVKFGATYLERQYNKSVEQLLSEDGVGAVIVFEKNGPCIHSSYGTFSYHPGMAVLRMQQIQQGKKDYLAEALALTEKNRVLDCTLGLAADAMIAAHYLGPDGYVVGLEASPLIHCAVKYGLAHYKTNSDALNAAMGKINAICITAQEYLYTCAVNSFDVVYFDPMFRCPVQGANAMDALRPLSYEQPLGKTTVLRALQIAPRVVIKERNEYILRAYGCRQFVGGKYSRFKYGIITRSDAHLIKQMAEDNL